MDINLGVIGNALSVTYSAAATVSIYTVKERPDSYEEAVQNAGYSEDSSLRGLVADPEKRGISNAVAYALNLPLSGSYQKNSVTVCHKLNLQKTILFY